MSPKSKLKKSPEIPLEYFEQSRERPGSDRASIEHELDMSEKEDEPRGDDILHSHGITRNISSVFSFDLSEEDREGDEMSGDDHSSGLQGGEAELGGQLHIDTGMPGDRTRWEEQIERLENDRLVDVGPKSLTAEELNDRRKARLK